MRHPTISFPRLPAVAFSAATAQQEETMELTEENVEKVLDDVGVVSCRIQSFAHVSFSVSVLASEAAVAYHFIALLSETGLGKAPSQPSSVN